MKQLVIVLGLAGLYLAGCNRKVEHRVWYYHVPEQDAAFFNPAGEGAVLGRLNGRESSIVYNTEKRITYLELGGSKYHDGQPVFYDRWYSVYRFAGGTPFRFRKKTP